MSMILGMDIGVFVAWILSILSAILCVIYGIYHYLKDKSSKKTKPSTKKTQPGKKEE